MSRILFILILVGVLVGCTVQQSAVNTQPKVNPSKLNWEIESGLAVEKAKQVFQQAVKDKVDLTNGPCLSNNLWGNLSYPETVWVLDVAHNPRQALDDRPENQCSAFREGKAVNFIEMDAKGDVITVYSPYLK